MAIKELLGIMPFDKDAEHTYTPKAFRELDVKYQAIFTLKSLSVSDRTELKKRMKTATEESTQKGYAILRKYVINWKNIIDAGTEEPIEYEADDNGYCSPKLWSIIPELVKVDLLKEVLFISGLLDKDKLGLD